MVGGVTGAVIDQADAQVPCSAVRHEARRGAGMFGGLHLAQSVVMKGAWIVTFAPLSECLEKDHRTGRPPRSSPIDGGATPRSTQPRSRRQALTCAVRVRPSG